MADRGVIFSAPMVRALLEGRKTQTRRLVTSPLRRCEVGDRLWVREAITVRGVYSDVVEIGYRAHKNASHTEFVEQWPVESCRDAEGNLPRVNWPRYRPSIHMPRWASRLTLIVTDVRQEPLQEISTADAIAEGGDPMHIQPGGATGNPSDGWLCFQSGFRALWDSLHDKPGERWEDNPEIVALTFKVSRTNIDAVAI